MANSRYEYVRLYEQADRLPLSNWIVVRIDGRGFHRFSNKHGFAKPNDLRAINLMNKTAEGVLRDVQDIVLGYGVSDEYSFVFHHSTNLYSRRSSKLVSTVVSTFTAHYITQWPAYFPDAPLVGVTPADRPPIVLPTGPLPTFDGRAVCYPRLQQLRDYLAWRQVDCHINNLYNTAFWALVQQGGLENRAAEQELAGTVSQDKHEMLWSRFGINYDREMEVFKKGSVIFREPVGGQGEGVGENKNGIAGLVNGEAAKDGEGGEFSKTQKAKLEKAKRKMQIVVVHEDIVKEGFWKQRSWLLVE